MPQNDIVKGVGDTLFTSIKAKPFESSCSCIVVQYAYQSFLFKMCRLNQLEEFHNSKDREIERLKVRCVLFHDLNELSIYRAHNIQGYEFASLLIILHLVN